MTPSCTVCGRPTKAASGICDRHPKRPPFLVMRYSRPVGPLTARKRITIAHQAHSLGEALAHAYGWRGRSPVWIERRGKPARSPWRRS